jgi:hypothetical protein
VGGLIYIPHPHSLCAPSAGACTRPPCSTRPLGPTPDDAPVRAQIRVPIAMAARELPSVRARTLCSRPVLPARADSPAIAPDAFALAVADARRIRARSYAPAPSPPVRAWSPRPILPARAHEHAFAPNTVALLPAGVRGRPVRARGHFPLAPLAAACASSTI